MAVGRGDITNKKAELSQWPGDAPYIWMPWKFSRVPGYAHCYFSRYFNGLLFRWIYAMSMRTKFEVLSFACSWDNRGYPKIWAVPGYAHAPCLPTLLMGFCSNKTVNVLAKFEVIILTRFWDNWGYPKNLGSLWIRPRSPFSKILNGLVFG